MVLYFQVCHMDTEGAPEDTEVKVRGSSSCCEVALNSCESALTR